MSEARYDDNGSLDEVVAEGVDFHLEQLNDGVWWIGLTYPDGRVDHITLSNKYNAKITGLHQADV